MERVMPESLQRPKQRPKKVKVTVLDDEKVPVNINLEEDIHASEKERAREEAALTSEPDWQAEQEKERLLTDFLEVADNLERALAHADAHPETLHEGVKTIQRQLNQTLAKFQVRPFDAEGQPFDPERHEAISVLQKPELPPNTVAQMTQTGYTIGDKVLRPARVIVSGER